MPQPRVLLTRRMPPPGGELLARAGYVVDVIEQKSPTGAELLERVAGASAMVCMLSERVDAELLDAAGSQFRVVANYAVGVDNIDLNACEKHGVRATNTPGVLTEATADLAWALILAAARHVPRGDQLVRSGRWPGWSPTELLGLEVSGATLGILGAGRIGTAVAMRSSGFRMRVLYSHPRENADLNERLSAVRVDLDRLLCESDILSLHIPMRAENHHLITADRIAMMKPTAILINTARGPIVDESALAAALRDKRIAAAGLDVYENEPRLTPGLAELPNVVLLPHLGSATTATREKMSEMAAANVIAVLSGHEPPNPVI